MNDDLINTVARSTNPTLKKKVLKDLFSPGDQNQVLTLLGKFHTMRLIEGGSIDDHLKKAQELKNRLSSILKRHSQTRH